MTRFFSPICRSGSKFLGGSLYNDARLARRHSSILARMVDCQSNVVHQISEDYAASRGYYRFLDNDRVTPAEMIEQISSLPVADLSCRSLVVLGDTTEISLKSQIAHIKDADQIGVLSDNKTPGFMAHVNLVLDAHSGDALGLSDLMLWTRPGSKGSRTERKKALEKRPWETKESYKWWQGVSHSQSVLDSAQETIFVFDSEADNAAIWESMTAAQQDMLVRVQQNERKIADQSTRLFAYLEEIEFCGQYPLRLSALNRRNYSRNQEQHRQARNTTMQFRYSPCKLQLRRRNPTSLDLFAIEARELAEWVPEGESPTHWYLLTNRVIESAEQARKMIQYYEWRWQIEQLFRILKRKGFAIEATELTSFDAILKQTILSFGAAFQVMQLLRARNQSDGQSIDEVFSQEKQQCLSILNQKYQGNTPKQHNPFSRDQLAWASWVIARIGGWKGYKSQHPPGPITFKRGLEKFNTYFDAWILFTNN